MSWWCNLLCKDFQDCIMNCTDYVNWLCCNDGLLGKKMDGMVAKLHELSCSNEKAVKESIDDAVYLIIPVFYQQNQTIELSPCLLWKNDALAWSFINSMEHTPLYSPESLVLLPGKQLQIALMLGWEGLRQSNLSENSFQK